MVFFKVKAVTYMLSVAILFGGTSGMGDFASDIFKTEAVQTDKKEELNLYAQSAVLMDADSGRILYGKNEEEIMANASTTKILTCILALEMGNLEDCVEVSKAAAKMPRVHLGMKTGQYFKLEDLLYSLMLESHNDSAVAIAEHIGGSVEGFATLMNEKAKSIGCENTFFITPNGLDAVSGERFHSTTATDLSRLMAYCIWGSPKKDEFLKICRQSSYSFSEYIKTENGFVAGGRSYNVYNKNAFLNMMEGALAGKTGFTGKAGYCYVAALSDGKRNFTIALLACGWPNNKNYKWADSKTLFRYGLDNFQYKNIVQNVELPTIELEGEIPYGLHKLPLYVCDNSEAFEVLLEESDKVEVKVYVPKKLFAPIEKNERVGRMEYFINGEVVKVCEIRAKAEVKEHTFKWSFLYVFKNWLVV